MAKGASSKVYVAESFCLIVSGVVWGLVYITDSVMKNFSMY